MTFLAIIALLGTASATPEPIASGSVVSATSPVPANNPGTWVSTQDYPAAALRAGSQGTVEFRLVVSPSGEPLGCAVRSGSGDQSLDDATCRQVMVRARFSPARDETGRPVIGFYTNRVRWTIPQPASPLQPGSVARSYDILPDGMMANCRVDSVSGVMAADFRVGPVPCAPGVQFERPFDSAGKPVIKHVVETMELRVSGDSKGL